ncbi:unnamed protein product [Closterium sp. NIES-53]
MAADYLTKTLGKQKFEYFWGSGPCTLLPGSAVSGGPVWLFVWPPPPLVLHELAASGQLFAAASRSGLESAPCSCCLLSHQTLLWHHRLGHPSLPRLRGMASRVLLSGLPRSLPPLPPGPAPTCVRCVEGGQRAAPHSSELPPTEAPLQTLHMDEWGPARVCGQGHERYFLLVVDDYSRYTIVFPLRRKGEVTETEVESFPLTFCEPSVVRRASARCSCFRPLRSKMGFLSAALAWSWTSLPRVSLLETTPTLRWTGKVGDASAFRVWGSRAFVRDLSADKLSSRAVPCVFLGVPPDAPGWQFYHPTSRRVLSSQDITFDESVPYYRLFPYRTAPLPPPPLFLAPGPPPVDPLPPQGPAPSGVSQVDAVEPVEVAVDSGATRGVELAGAGSGGAEPERAEPGGAESGGAEPGVAESGGAEPESAEHARAESRGAAPGGPSGVSSRREPLSPQQLREWFARHWSRAAGAGGATGAGGSTGAGAAGGSGVTCPGGARTGGTGAAGPGGATGAGAAGAGGTARVGAAGGMGAGATGASEASGGSAGAGGAAGAGAPWGAGVGATGAAEGAAGAGGVGPDTGGAGALPAGFGGAARPRPYFVLILEQVLGLPPSTGPAPFLECPPPVQSQSQLQPSSPLPAPSPYTCPIGGTYVDEVPPPGENIVDGMWILRVKRPPGSLPVFKARYVARGFSQRQGVDYFHTFSPTPKMTTLRVVLHVAAQRDYELHSLDFSTAFLQGSLHEEIWLCRLPGFTGSFPAGTQWSLRRPVYSLCQAPHKWHDTLRTTLAALGFAPSTADPSMFLRTDTTLPPFYILVYVDDLVFATADTAGLAHVKSELQKRHTCTYLGELRSYLGLQITQDRARRTITFTRSHMVQQVLQRFNYTYSSPQSTPLSTPHSLSAQPSDESKEPSGPYPELVGYLMYLMTCTRPDLAYPLGILAHYVAPGRHRPEHMDAAKRVLRYLCSTLGMGLLLGGRAPAVRTGHADASWVDNLATQQSSSCEAEIYAKAMAAQELRWLTYLLTDVGEAPRSPPQRSHLHLAYVATRANTADIFTKALQPCDHQCFCTMLACFALLDWSCDLLFSPILPMGALYDGVVARYSSPATAALGRLLVPYLFPELSAFATVEDLQVLGVPSSTCLTPPLLCPPPDQSQPPLQPACPLLAPSPYSEQAVSPTERREPASHLASLVRTARCVPRLHPPLIPGTHAMAVGPSSVPLRVPLPAAPESSLPAVPDPKRDRARAASLTLVYFAVASRRVYATSLVAEYKSASPPSVGGECALGTDVLEDRQEDFECLTAIVPRFTSMLLAPEGDPEHQTSRPRALTQRQLRVPTPLSGRKPWIPRWHRGSPQAPTVKRAPGFPLAFKARYVAQGFSQRQGVDYFQTFSPTLNMTTLRVLLHVAVQRDYELYPLDFSTAFLQGSLHEEIWLRRPPGFTGSFPPTPVSTSHSLSAPPSDKSIELSGTYPELVGCLMYLMMCIRPDLAYPLSLLARYVAPSMHRKSTRSSSVLSSSCEAEIFAGAMAARELCWLTYLLTDLGEQPRSPPVLIHSIDFSILAHR